MELLDRLRGRDGTTVPRLAGELGVTTRTIHRVGLGFRYQDREGRRTARRTEPHGLPVQSPVWYVLGRDLDKGLPRMFRMDRMTSPLLLLPEVHFQPSAELIWSQLPPEIAWRPLTGARGR